MNLIGNINAIPFRRFRGGGGVTPFPSIPGIVVRYSALGLTNEQMATNPVWVDKTGNGHDIQLKNFSWKGMSGVGGYVGDFSKWVNNRDTTEIGITKSNSKVIIDVKVSQGSGKNIVFISKSNLGISNNVTIKITSTYPEGVMKFANSASNKYLKLPSNGIITLQDNPEYTSNEMYLHLASADLGQITIEQLPLYPGALVFDGVDDYGTCNNFPILTKEKGYTVVALRQWDQDFLNTTLTGGLLSTRNYSTGEGVAFEKIESSNKGYWNLGAGGFIDFAKSPFTWQTSKQYNNVGILKGNKNHRKPLCVGSGLSGGQQCGRFAIWEIVILDHDATEEELTKIKDYFVKTYPWLFPDQAWTVVGKTNEDEDRATIANITGNGNNLVLSNFGFAEGSGYGLYKTPFELYPSVQHSSKYSLSFSKFALGDHNLIIAPKQNDLSYDIKVKVTGLKDGVKFKWGWIGTTGYIDITTDGIHMLNKSASQIRQLIVEFAEDFDPDHVVTIEQIPEYEGYLITDGVDDKITSSIFKMGNDWTVIGDWELINTGKKDNVGIVKFNSIVIYNYNPILINIKNGRNNLIPDQNTVNAICSDGRIYSKDWKESIYNEETESTSKNLLTIGYSGNDYTKIAFRNLAIYPTVLSKEDCIKAYNYLQTLKAK